VTNSFGASFVSYPAPTEQRRNVFKQKTGLRQFNPHYRLERCSKMKPHQFSAHLCSSKTMLRLSQLPAQHFRTTTTNLNNTACCTPAPCTSKEEAASRNLVLSFIYTLNKKSNTTEPGGIDSYQSIVDTYFAETIEVIDTSFYLPILGKDALRKAISQLFYVNGTHKTMNVKFVSIASDTLCPDDNKVAVCYEYVNDDDVASSMSGIGISIYTVHEGKITQIFDVKDGAKFDIDSWRVEDMQKKKIPVETKAKAFLRDVIGEPADVMQRFIAARNKKSLDEIFHTLSANCTVRILGMDECASKNCETFAQSLQMLPDTATIELEDIVAPSNSTDGLAFAACRWVVAIDGQRQRFSRGCSFFCFENGSIVSVIDIPESVKQEEFNASLGLKPAYLNFLRDSGLGRTVADTLLVASIPSILKSNPMAIPTFADLTLRRTHVQYGEHSSQFIDLFLPQDETKLRGLIFFVVR